MKRTILILINIFLLGFCFSQDLDNKDVFVFIDISGSMYSDFEKVKDYVNYNIIDNIDPGTRLVLFKFYEKNVCFYDGIMENELSFQYAKSLVNSLKANGPWTNLDNIKIYLQENKLSVENSRIYILSDGFIQEKDFANEYYVTDGFWNGLGIVSERIYDDLYLYKFEEVKFINENLLNTQLNSDDTVVQIEETGKSNSVNTGYFIILFIILLIILLIILVKYYTSKKSKNIPKTPEELEKFQKEIDREINDKHRLLKNHDSSISPIYDGIVNEKEYLKAKYKLLWVLKEPYDQDGGGWSLREILNPSYYNHTEEAISPISNEGGGRTNRNILFISHGILNGFLHFENPNMEYINNHPDMEETFSKIARINISKLPGGTTSDNSEIEKKYEFWRGVILRQIKGFNPDVIVFGNTFFPALMHDLGINDNEMKSYPASNLLWCKKKGCLYISANHPGIWIDRQEYINSIIELCRDNL